MYTINNIVQSALRKSDDRLSILVLNEHYDDYIKRFEYLDHDFYLANDMYGVPQWASPLGFNNIHIANRLQDHCLSHIDAIVVFNRAGLWERAKQLSDTWHIPLIVIDITCSANHVPLPFFATVAVNNPPQLFQRNGHVSVGITEDVANSWQSPYQSLSMHIPIAPMPIQRKENADKILIDTSLPQEYIDSLPFVASPDKFTTDPTEAKIYLHLWRNVTPLMIDCMASDIPVITMSDQDFVDIINKHKKGLDTIQELISVWAPPVENDTTSYIKHVSQRSGIPSNVVFSPTKTNFLAIAKAMAISENGPDALLIPDSDWNEGWRLANQRADIKSYVK